MYITYFSGWVPTPSGSCFGLFTCPSLGVEQNFPPGYVFIELVTCGQMSDFEFFGFLRGICGFDDDRLIDLGDSVPTLRR